MTLHADEHVTSPWCACDCPDCEGERHVIHSEPGFPRALRDPNCRDCLERRPHVEHERYGRPARAKKAPVEAAVRDERDPAIETESELRMIWGDR